MGSAPAALAVDYVKPSDAWLPRSAVPEFEFVQRLGGSIGDGGIAGTARDLLAFVRSFTKGQLLGGLDAPTGGQAQSNPHPVLIRLSDNAVLPNRFRGEYRECFVIAAGYGDISSERAYLRTENLSCVRADGATLDAVDLGFDLGTTGIAWSCADRVFYGVDGNADTLFTLDPATGQIGDVRALGVDFTYVGIEYEPSSGTLLASTGSALYRIEPSTATASWIANLSLAGVNDLALYPECP